MKNTKLWKGILLGLSMMIFINPILAQRIKMPLDGQWEIEESIDKNTIPESFNHKVQVPGLVHLALPSFPDVDHFETKDYVQTMVNAGILPSTDHCDSLYRTNQKRNYFWYKKSFIAPSKKELATLVVNKAQFGTAVWLNGNKIGEHLGCFTAGKIELREAIRWNEENSLAIRIGAHPGVMPHWAPWGNDGEKEFWTPGIYDSVSLIFADSPAIKSIQVAPKIDSSKIIVQTHLKNPGSACTSEVVHQVKTWKGQQLVGEPVILKVFMEAGEEKTIIQEVNIPNAILWNCENPFLYVLETKTSGDNCTTRFGMREFRFDTPTRRAYLNNEIFFMRGATITLHRFFADPLSKGLPWDEDWIRKLLIEIPEKMNWNSFRICLGPAPQKWLDIADEAGIILQWEYPIWSDRDPWYYRNYKEEEVAIQLKELMQDNWNHPSVAIWDASNETKWDFLGDKAIPEVRKLDLSNRPWDNGYNPPQGINDPREVHPYMFINHFFTNIKGPNFEMTFLETMAGGKHPRGGNSDCTGHPWIINEYGWLWLHRDGTPTVLSKPAYQNLGLLTPETTAEERFKHYAYLLGGLTEYWRAFRNYAGVMYLAFLDGDIPNCFTCDNLRDVENLEFEPNFADYMHEAFKPLGVYINFWQPTSNAGKTRKYRVMLVNDEQKAANGILELSWRNNENQEKFSTVKTSYVVGATGQMTIEFELKTPDNPGKYSLEAKASWEGQSWSPTISRRKVEVVAH